jgi:NADH:ubiquinone oxidoreductase subunit 2 (subunit N)
MYIHTLYTYIIIYIIIVNFFFFFKKKKKIRRKRKKHIYIYFLYNIYGMMYCVMNKDAIFYLISVRSNNLILDSVD